MESGDSLPDYLRPLVISENVASDDSDEDENDYSDDDAWPILQSGYEPPSQQACNATSPDQGGPSGTAEEESLVGSSLAEMPTDLENCLALNRAQRALLESAIGEFAERLEKNRYNVDAVKANLLMQSLEYLMDRKETLADRLLNTEDPEQSAELAERIDQLDKQDRVVAEGTVEDELQSPLLTLSASPSSVVATCMVDEQTLVVPGVDQPLATVGRVQVVRQAQVLSPDLHLPSTARPSVIREHPRNSLGCAATTSRTGTAYLSSAFRATHYTLFSACASCLPLPLLLPFQFAATCLFF
ncbi:hypothetical protein HPB49_010635 [Dermacentor silvarum]|uniref:Uncharacterized protein n=1 Tax=Dermacentor silvarum TaxID=543639 RepID=A0ACB8CR81_DERSI|nr:hypothetical protein HPB49_010635 [Dermacentor silvarum]